MGGEFGSAAWARAQQIEVLLEIKEQGMKNFAELRHNAEQTAGILVVLTRAAERTAGAAEELARANEELAGSLKEVKRQAVEATAATGLFGATNKKTAGLIGAVWGALTAPRGWIQVLVTALTILAGPLMAFGGLIAASTAVMVAWTVGAAGMILLLGGLALGFAAVGGAIIAMGLARMKDFAAPAPGAAVSAGGHVNTAAQHLADAQRLQAQLQARMNAQGHGGTLSQQQAMVNSTIRVQRAQDAYNASLSTYGGIVAVQQTSLQTFTAQFTKMWDALESSAVPLARMALNFARTFFPFISKDGERIIHWFGARMPGALKEIHKVFNDLLPPFSKFVGFLGRMFDTFGPKIGPMFEQGVLVALPIVMRLLDVLGRLTNWFIVQLPIYAPIVLSVFNWIGHAVEVVAGVWGRFADWGAKTFFPLITNIQKEWNKPGVGSGFMAEMNKNLPQIGKNLDLWIQNSPKWIPAILNVAEAFVAIVTAVTNLVTWVGGLINMLSAWADNNGFWSSLQGHIIDLGNWLKNVNDNLTVDMGGAFNPAGNTSPGSDRLAYKQAWERLHPGVKPPWVPVTGPPATQDRASGGGPIPATTNSKPPASQAPVSVTQNIYGAHDPQVTARQSARLLRNLLQT